MVFDIVGASHSAITECDLACVWASEYNSTVTYYYLLCFTMYYSQSCLRGWRLFTLVACWFSPSDILKPFLINYLQQNASDPSRPYHAAAHNCLQQLRKTIKYGGRKNVPSSEEVAAITVSCYCLVQLLATVPWECVNNCVDPVVILL